MALRGWSLIGLLISGDRLVHFSLGGLHFTQLDQGIGVAIELDGLLQRGLGAVQVLLISEEHSSEQIVEAAIVGRLGDLGLGRRNGLVDLVLYQENVDQSTQSIAGVDVTLQSILVGLARLIVLLLHEP